MLQMRRQGCKMGGGFPKVSLMESGRARVHSTGWAFQKKPGFFLLLRQNRSLAQTRVVVVDGVIGLMDINSLLHSGVLKVVGSTKLAV